MILRVDNRRRRVYFGSRLHPLRVHHGAIGIGCVAGGHRAQNKSLSTVLVLVGAILMWDDLPDLRKSWWVRDV